MAQRKLQQEMDRVFKKVAEGVQTFDAIYDKVQSSSNQSQKEKLESDLKREIKKLQRLRDQIKTWMGSNDIKDKKMLTEQRKLIESEMERFKACEKEMKTKAYSKEGLTNLLKLDPREKEKQEMCDFLANTLEELENQTDNLETEMESLQGTMKKGKKDNLKAERIVDIEETLERHKWHQSKLELILRLLENGQIATEQVENIQEDIKYYIESNQEVDFDYDDEIYDELNLDQDEDLIGMDGADFVKDEGVSTLEDLAADLSLSGIITRDGESQSKPESPVPGSTPRSQSVSLSSSNPPPNSQPNPKLSLKTDSKFASAASSPLILSPSLKSSSVTMPTSSDAPTTPVPNAWAAPDKIEALKIKGHNESPSASKSVPVSALTASITTPTTSATSTATTTTPSTPAKELFVVSESVPKPQNLTSLTSRSSSVPAVSASPVSPSTEKTSRKSNEPLTSASTVSTTAVSASDETCENITSTSSENDNTTANISSDGSNMKISMRNFNLPPGLQDFVKSFEAARQRVENPPPITSIIKLLESSYEHIPSSVDADFPNYYRPVNPYPTASYYPQQPITYLRDAGLLEKMSIDTLLYIFYYKQGTYDQYLAAKELKRRSWRYHKKFLTWFQRHEEPSVINDEYEQGSYVYFDFEGMWTQRKKSNFQFAYEFLEDEI